jgi:hypothetical protein
VYYFDRADGLKSISGKTELPEERMELELLCNTYWDMFGRSPPSREQVDVFRRAAHQSCKLVWDWAMIGIALHCRFEPSFRALFIELLNDDDLDVRRRMASKVARLEGDALTALGPALTKNSDAQVRLHAYQLLEKESSDDASVCQAWRDTVSAWLENEMDTENRDFLTSTQRRLSALVARSRKSRDVYDWKHYECQLLKAVEMTIQIISGKHPEICFRGCLIYCDVTNFSVVLQLERSHSSDIGGDDPKNWNFDDFPEQLGAGEPFERLWSPIELEIIDKRHVDDAPWAADSRPEDDFVRMGQAVANKLQHSDAVKKLNKAAGFRVVCLTDGDS